MDHHHMHRHRHLGWGLLRKIGRWLSGIPSFISDMPTLIRTWSARVGICGLILVLVPNAKTAKIVRGIVDAVAKIPGTSDLQIALCRDMVEWTRAEKRMFLR